ncbi:hypothetical protein SAMN02910456_00374 [Ruminococcaceae bacterium YRB3002]|nr:hypothetical protein SAMN02910456_00374 [Ruminococcaceae bacterium YRB3002]
MDYSYVFGDWCEWEQKIANAFIEIKETETLPKYRWIMNKAKEPFSFTDYGFRSAYCDYYTIVFRKRDWVNHYFKLFADAYESYKTKPVDVNNLLVQFAQEDRNHKVELSFISKMAATIDPEVPIYDVSIGSLLGLSTSSSSDYNVRIGVAERVYDQVKDFYGEILNNESEYYKIYIQRALNEFYTVFPEYKDITPVKVIDFVIWGDYRFRKHHQ